MKHSIFIFMIMTAKMANAQNVRASTVKKAFSRETSVSTSIKADLAIVWALLTNASDFPRWNSTVTALEGEISEGGKIRLRSVLDEKRTFKLKIKKLIPEKTMVWGDGKGNRIYEISQGTGNTVIFSMSEKIGGLMFPMYAKYIPSFDEVFDQFATDLKNEAESIQNEK